VKHEETVHSILKSNLALGHKFQDILEAYGMENAQAREAARAIATAVEQHLTLLGNTLIETGYPECGRALWLEAKSLLNT